jgi:2,3-diaminopropionate biosynthesis protein SbnB
LSIQPINTQVTSRIQSPELLYLSRQDLLDSGGGHSNLYIKAIKEVLISHANGQYVQPLKPYLRVVDGINHIADRIIAMPSHIGGEHSISGIKWIGSKHDNPQERGLERASGVIILNDPETNYPIAILEAGWISGMRTAAVTAVAAQFLAKQQFKTIACMGCGWIAKLQLKTMIEQFSTIETIYLYDINSNQLNRFVKEMSSLYPDVQFIEQDSAEEAVRKGEVIITCTVTAEPYLPYEWLQAGAFVSNVSIMDIQKDVFLKADKVVVDDWEQSNREKKVINQLVLEGKFSRNQLYAELGQIISGQKAGREDAQEIIVLNPMGMAIEDLACAYALYNAASQQKKGHKLPLYG